MDARKKAGHNKSRKWKGSKSNRVKNIQHRKENRINNNESIAFGYCLALCWCNKLKTDDDLSTLDFCLLFHRVHGFKKNATNRKEYRFTFMVFQELRIEREIIFLPELLIATLCLSHSKRSGGFVSHLVWNEFADSWWNFENYLVLVTHHLIGHTW